MPRSQEPLTISDEEEEQQHAMGVAADIAEERNFLSPMVQVDWLHNIAGDKPLHSFVNCASEP